MKVFLQVLSFFPYILQAVMAVEAALKGQPGATKKAVVMAAISAGAQIGETVPQPVVDGVSKLVDGTVAALNASGLLGAPTTSTTAK